MWQCGGAVENIPCSRVGHIFRNFHPYTFPGDKDTHGINTARTVEVWMDEYKELFYLHRPDLRRDDLGRKVDLGDLNKRINFRKSLKCKSFTWYLENIYPQKYIPNDPTHVLAYGKLTNEGFDQEQCVDTLQQDDKDNFYIGVYPCHNNIITTSQFFSFSKKLELRHEDNCASVGKIDDEEGMSEEKYYSPIKMTTCSEHNTAQKWKLSKKGRVMNLKTKKCLDIVDTGSNEVGGDMSLVAVDCRRAPSQLWSFDQNFQ